MPTTHQCLFEKWQSESAPMFHTSSLWPVFSEEDIKAFLNGSGEAPRPSSAASLEHARTTQATIQAFVTKVEALSEADYACKTAYLEFERERLAALDLVLHHDNPEKVAHYNDLLYGPLTELHQDEALAYLKHYVEHLEPACDGVADMKTRLLETWSDVTGGDGITRLFEAFEHYRMGLRPLVEERFWFMSEILAPYSGKDKLSSEMVADILQQALGRVLGESLGEWKSAVQAGAPNVFIDYARLAIVVPAERLYTLDAARALAIHEIGSHITRSVNGAHSHERLAGLGMAGYGPAEEALGSMIGGASNPKRTYISNLLSLAVLDFVARHKDATFRDIHELTRALMICIANPDADTLRDKDYDYRRLAFSRVIRVLRLGTPELIERSTTKYWRGLLIMNRYFEAHGLNQASLGQFFEGKYDCLSARQLQLIRTHSLSA